MVFLLALLSFITVAAGVFGLGLGVPIRETWFGAALLMTGSVAVTGGFILVGLAAGVHELRQIRQGFKAPPSGMTRPVRPLERRDEERFDNVDGQMASPMRMPVPLGTDAHDMIPAKFDGADTRERWRKGGPEEWLLRAMAEIESAPRHTDAAPAPTDYHPGDIRRRSNSWPRPAITLPPDHFPPYPPPLGGEGRVGGHRRSPHTTYSQRRHSRRSGRRNVAAQGMGRSNDPSHDPTPGCARPDQNRRLCRRLRLPRLRRLGRRMSNRGRCRSLNPA